MANPEIIMKDFKNIEAYFGLAKLKILPPRWLYHLILSYRCKGKLMFPLCKTCTDNKNQDQCQCTDQSRMFIDCWTILEIQKAIKLGYKVVKIYKVCHWEQSTKYNPETGEGGLFADYVNQSLKIK